MAYKYYVYNSEGEKVDVSIRPATQIDLQETKLEHWQGDWTKDVMHEPGMENYAIIVEETKRLIGLGSYIEDKAGISVFISYGESHPESNPTIVKKNERMYYNIGQVIIAFGVQLSLDRGYDGTVYFKAKTTELYKHYIKDFGAIDLPREPYMLILFDEQAVALLNDYNEEEDAR